MTTVQYVLGAALALLTFVVLVNFVVFVYARGVVRAAVDEGARNGARSGAGPGDCETRASDVLADLLGGGLGEGVSIRCRGEGDSMRARAQVTLRGWLPPLVPDWSFDLEARSATEPP
jgi:hypothetical protein